MPDEPPQRCMICEKHAQGGDVPGGVLYAGTPRTLRGLGAVHLARSPHRDRGGQVDVEAVCDRLRRYLSGERAGR